MPEIKTRRPYQERFLDGYERHELREQVQKVKPSRFSILRKKTVIWGLGASLALGGLGVPLAKLGLPQQQTAAKRERKPVAPAGPATAARVSPAPSSPVTASIPQPALPAPVPAISTATTTEAGTPQDLATAQKIASQLNGGVTMPLHTLSPVPPHTHQPHS